MPSYAHNNLDTSGTCRLLKLFHAQNCWPHIKHKAEILGRSRDTEKKQRVPPKIMIASGLREIHLPAEKQMFVWNESRIPGRKGTPEPAEQVGRCSPGSVQLPQSRARAENCLSAPSEKTNLTDQPPSAFSFSRHRQRLDNKALLLVNKVH